MELSKEERELITFSLYMRRNYIETGDALLSAQDAKNMRQEKIKVLSKDQYRLIAKIDDLIEKIEK